MSHRLPVLLLAAVLATGCTVGPDYVRPSIDTVPEFAAASMAGDTAAASAGPAAAPDAAWWGAFGDPLLVELVAASLAHNQDLEAARARVREARALGRATASRRRPQVDAGATGQALRQSETGASAPLFATGLADPEADFFQVGFDAGWEIDVFGGVRRSVQAADARIGAAEEARRQVLVSVAAEVARAFTELRGGQRRLDLAQRNVELAAETHEVVSNKARAGLVPELDVRRSATQLEATRARVPAVRADVRAAAHRLGVLTGQTPTALLDRLLAAAPLPRTPDLVPVGLPSDLIERRPDVRRAERRLAAATADIGVRTADLYPRFFLTGSAGVESGSFTDLFESASRVWSLGPSISWPLLQGGRLRAGVDAATASQDAAHAELRQAVLLALEDVETALVRYGEEQLRRRSLARAADAAARSLELARILYDKGLEDFLPVLDAERTLTEVQDQLAVSETAAVLGAVSLYKALGGGWQVAEASGPDTGNGSEAVVVGR